MSKLTLVLVAIMAVVCFDVTSAEGESKGPFQHQVLNDLFRAWLTTAKIVIDVLRRNLQNEAGFKSAVAQVFKPILDFLREVLTESAGAKVDW